MCAMLRFGTPQVIPGLGEEPTLAVFEILDFGDYFVLEKMFDTLAARMATQVPGGPWTLVKYSFEERSSTGDGSAPPTNIRVLVLSLKATPK